MCLILCGVNSWTLLRAATVPRLEGCEWCAIYLVVFAAELTSLLAQLDELRTTQGVETGPDRLVREAAQGNHLEAVREILSKYPEKVCYCQTFQLFSVSSPSASCLVCFHFLDIATSFTVVATSFTVVADFVLRLFYFLPFFCCLCFHLWTLGVTLVSSWGYSCDFLG